MPRKNIATINKVVAAVGARNKAGQAAVSVKPWKHMDILSSTATVGCWGVMAPS